MNGGHGFLYGNLKNTKSLKCYVKKLNCIFLINTNTFNLNNSKYVMLKLMKLMESVSESL